MEIDLEVPSTKQDNLDVGGNRNPKLKDSAGGMHFEEDDANSPTIENGKNDKKGVSESQNIEDGDMSSSRSERDENVIRSSLTENVSCGGQQVDVNLVAGQSVRIATVCEPHNGLEFDSKEAAYCFYREYARSVGFGITIKASRRSKKTGNFIDVKIVCSRFGSKRESDASLYQRSCPKTDCKAGVHMKRREDGKWVIHSFVKEHNHEICPDDFYYSIRGRSKQSARAACKKGLQLALGEGDIQTLFEHFMCMQDDNPNFFYAVDFDHDKRLRNVFWVDAKGRNDYKNFSDVVFFDTYYIKSKYKVPFCPVIGVNNHFQFMLLGCALIGDETKSTFVWLMCTWLKAVGGQAPRVILTDQGKFLKEAVADVFPDARHCFCLWHVMRNIYEQVDHVSNKFLTKFYKCIYQSWTDVQFEKRWWRMVEIFGLRDEWVKSLYEDRDKWVPTYMRDVVFAGMSTVERSGSITSYFDKYFQRETIFKEFIKQYNAYLQERYETETKADFETLQKQAAVKSFSSFEKQMSTIYTDAVFKQFQVEVVGTDSCNLKKEHEYHRTTIFEVDDFEQHQSFIVAWNATESDLNCLCRSFEYRGFLCRHALLVLKRSGVSNIPSRYILKRWSRDAKFKQPTIDISTNISERAQRFNDLCQRAVKLGGEGSLSQEACSIALQALEEIMKQCVRANNSAKSVAESGALPVHVLLDGKEQNQGKGLAKPTKKKKTCNKRKVCAEAEGITTTTQNVYQHMVNMKARPVHLDNYRVPQPDVQEMQQSSRAEALDICGAHRGTGGEGELLSVPMLERHHQAQQSFQTSLQGQHNSGAPTAPDEYELHAASEPCRKACACKVSLSIAVEASPWPSA